MTALVLAGFACLGAGMIVDLALGTRQRVIRVLPYLIAMAGSASMAVAGGLALGGRHETVDLGRFFDLGTTELRLDALAGLFLVLTSGLGVAVSACFASWAGAEGRVRGRGLAAAYALLLGAVAAIVLAADAFLFVFAWETLTLAFYALSAYGRRDMAQARAAWLTASIGRLSGAAVLFSFLLLAGASHTFAIAGWATVGGGAVRDTAWIVAVVGFGAKVGVVPLQSWMPVGYPAAPGPARAAMAGLAVNVGFYGLWRMLAVLGPPPVGLAVAVLVVGAFGALLGITFAAVQQDLNRLIAYSSVENGGLILTGYGVALAGASTGRSELVAIGLLAATMQAVAHAVAKSTMYLSAASAEAATGSTDMDVLAGVARAQPVAGAGFGASALTLAGLPPTIGFVSEWFLLEALLQQFRISGLSLRLGMAWAGALVALTVGIAALTFLRLLGFVVLGAPRAGRRGSSGWLGSLALATLAFLCFAVAALTPWEIRVVARGLGPAVAPELTRGALASPWVLQPVYAKFSVLSPSWLMIMMPTLFAATVALGIVLSRGRLLRVRRVPAWRSATSGVSGPDRYTSFGYANPIRHVLGNLLHTETAVAPVADRDGGGRHLQHVTTIVEPVETYLYRPAQTATLWVVGHLKRLQSGRLDAYIAYMLVALLAVLAVVAALR